MSSGRLSGEEALRQEIAGLRVSRRLMRSGSQKVKKGHLKGISLKCLSLYSRGGGCKVGAEICDEFGDPSSRMRSSASDGYRPLCGTEEAGVDCFSYGVRERFWKKHNKKEFELEESIRHSRMHIFLPDDILELCLVRLPLTSLMTARLVCKKWKRLTTTPRFLHMRREGSHQNPWLFMFGAVKDGYSSGVIHALDVYSNQWHGIEADILKGRFMFSVASIQEDIYIVGGCSSFNNSGWLDRSSFKTHRGVMMFSPLTKSWRKVASMKHARSTPVLGVSEIGFDFSIVQSHHNRQDRRIPRSRVGGVLDVYEGPHRLSLRRQSRPAVDGNESSILTSRRSFKFIKHKNDHSGIQGCKRFVLIAVGGLGQWDEPLDSGEIYDSVSNKWAEIQRFPLDFGIIASGVVCNGMFYAYSETDKLAGYDIEHDFWFGIQTSPFPSRVLEYYPKLVSCNGRLFMLSVLWCEGDGQIGCRNKAVRKLWELDLMYHNWYEVSVHPDAPMDWNSGFVADGNLIFGIELFKIFGQVLDFFTVCDVSDAGMKWRHISRNHVTRELDASSCMTKSMAVLHL